MRKSRFDAIPTEETPQISIKALDEAGFLSGNKETGTLYWPSPHSKIAQAFEFWNIWIDEYDTQDDWLGSREEWDEEYAALPDKQKPPRMMKEGWMRFKSVHEVGLNDKGRLVASKRRPVDQTIFLTTTPCAYGGMRFWFQCPVPDCGARVRILYLVDDLLGCRKCHSLLYETQTFSKKRREHGRIIPEEQLERMRQQVKRPVYGGKFTKEFKRVSNLEAKSDAARQFLLDRMKAYADANREWLRRHLDENLDPTYKIPQQDVGEYNDLHDERSASQRTVGS